MNDTLLKRTEGTQTHLVVYCFFLLVLGIEILSCLHRSPSGTSNCYSLLVPSPPHQQHLLVFPVHIKHIIHHDMTCYIFLTTKCFMCMVQDAVYGRLPCIIINNTSLWIPMMLQMTNKVPYIQPLQCISIIYVVKEMLLNTMGNQVREVNHFT